MMDDIGTLAELLHETAEHHDRFEKAAPPHDWWDWYAPYLSARQHGSAPDEASAAAHRTCRRCAVWSLGDLTDVGTGR
jgi:hypothetical protein